ncbi:MAG: hypothetical protein ACRDRH_02230 [Pseudonocardia sp.]
MAISLADVEVAGLVELDLTRALDLADDTCPSAPARFATRTPRAWPTTRTPCSAPT